MKVENCPRDWQQSGLDAPATLDIEKCLVPSTQKISEVLQELGYKSLVKRVDIKSQERLFDL